MSDQLDAASPRDIGDVLTIGFGTTVAMWGVGYVCRLPGTLAPAWLLLVLVCLLAGGWCAGRYAQRGWHGGLYVGLLSGVLNLLILGSLLAGNYPHQAVPSAVWWIPGSLIVAMLLAAAGASVGTLSRCSVARTTIWPARFATVATVATLLLLTAGGVVTGYESGLAVPDWPNSFGYNMFLYPLSRMTGGIYYEHSHRLLGSLVGLTTLVLAAYLHVVDNRRWLRRCAWLALLMVIIQGLLGGLRVTGRFTFSSSAEDLTPKISLAIVHGVVGQLFFSMLVALRVFLSASWRSGRPPAPAPAATTDRVLNVALIALLCIQLILGALLRHILAGLHLHMGIGVVVAVVAIAVGLRAWGLHEKQPIIPKLGGALLLLMSVQVALGVAALIATGMELREQPPTSIQVVITTAHQTIGALLLASAVALLLWSFRLLTPAVGRKLAPGPGSAEAQHADTHSA